MFANEENSSPEVDGSRDKDDSVDVWLRRLDKIRNMVIKEKAEVALIEGKMRETRSRWVGHVKRRSVNAPIRRCEVINLMHCRRGRRRPKPSWNKVIRGDLNFMRLT